MVVTMEEWLEDFQEVCMGSLRVGATPPSPVEYVMEVEGRGEETMSWQEGFVFLSVFYPLEEVVVMLGRAYGMGQGKQKQILELFGE